MLFLVRLKPAGGAPLVVNGVDAILVSAADGAEALTKAQEIAGGSTVWAGADFMVLTDAILNANGGHVFLSVSSETLVNWDNGSENNTQT